jgi:hypothetical protein
MYSSRRIQLPITHKQYALKIQIKVNNCFAFSNDLCLTSIINLQRRQEDAYESNYCLGMKPGLCTGHYKN